MTAHLFISTLLSALLFVRPPHEHVRLEHVRLDAAPTSWLIRDATRPVVTFGIGWRGGSASDPEGKEGMTALLARLMQGRSSMPADDADGHANAGDYAVRTDVVYDDDLLIVVHGCLTTHMDACVNAFRRAVSDADFDPAAVERAKIAQISDVRRAESNPYAAAANAFRSLIFPDGHPYGRAASGSGTVEGISRIMPSDLDAHRHALLARDNLLSTAVGHISNHRLANVMHDMISDLPQAPSLDPIPAARIADGPLATHVRRDGPQTVIVFGHRGIPADHPGFHAALVANHLLGGGGVLSSTLMRRLRSDLGWTYDVGTTLIPDGGDGDGTLWVGQIAVGNDVAAKTLDVVREEMRKMIRDEVTDDALRTAKTHLIEARRLSLGDGSDVVASRLLYLRFMRPSSSRLQEDETKIAAVTAQDVRAAAALFLKPDMLIVGSAGAAAAAPSREGDRPS